MFSGASCRWLVVAALLALVPGALRAEQVIATDEEVLAMARKLVGQRWYGVYVMGKKVGWQMDRWEESGETICNDVEFTLKMAFLGQVSTTSARERTCYDLVAPFGMRSFRSDRDEAGRATVIVGKPGEGKLVYRVTTGAKPREHTVDAASDRLDQAVGWAALGRLKQGDHVASVTLDELTGKVRWQRFTLKESANRLVRGRQMMVHTILIEEESGMALDALVSGDGVVIEGTLGPSIRIVLEDRESATSQESDLLDFYSSAFVKVKGMLDYSRIPRIRRLKARLSGQSTVQLAANRRQQTSEPQERSLVIEVAACPPAADGQVLPEEFTRCNADLPCDNEEVVKIAREATAGRTTPLERALALSDWVNRSFTYSLAAGGGTGDQILSARKGDCSEYSKALVTLLRAAGMPARALSGVVPADSTPPTFGYHAWAEVWLADRGWVSLDPTWGFFPVDAGHIVFDVDDGLQMAAHLGGLEIELLEVDYEPGNEGGIKCD